MMNERARLTLFRLWLAGLALGALLEIVGCLARTRHAMGAGGQLTPAALFYLLSNTAAIAALALGSFIAWRADRTPAARWLASFLVLWTWVYTSVFIRIAFPNPGFELAGGGIGDSMLVQLLTAPAGKQILVLAAVWLTVLAFLRFSVLFPRRLLPETLASGAAAGHAPADSLGWVQRIAAPGERQLVRLLNRHGSRWASRVASVRFPPTSRRGAEAYLRLFEPKALTVIGAVLLGLSALSVVSGVAHPTATFVNLLGSIVIWSFGLQNLRFAYQMLDPMARRRVLWLTEGFILLISGTTLIGVVSLAARGLNLQIGSTPAMAWIYAVSLPLLVLAVLSCLVIAILHDGAIDPRLTIRHTLVYGALATLATVVFALCENLASGYLAGLLALPEHAAPWIATVVLALVVGPLQSRIAQVVRRILRPEDSQEHASRARPLV